MPAISEGCFFTTVKNTSGATKHFGFLPPHGRTLEDDEELHIFGELQSACLRVVDSQRVQDALNNAVDSGDLEIKSSPCLVVYDIADLTSYRIGSDNATFDVQAPRWDSFNPYEAP